MFLPISGRGDLAPLVSARAVLASLVRAGFPAGFLLGLASFLGAGALALPPLAGFWPLGALFFLVPSFCGGFLRRNTGALCRNGGGVFSGRGFYGLHAGSLSFRRLIRA